MLNFTNRYSVNCELLRLGIKFFSDQSAQDWAKDDVQSGCVPGNYNGCHVLQSIYTAGQQQLSVKFRIPIRTECVLFTLSYIYDLYLLYIIPKVCLFLYLYVCNRRVI